MERVLEDAKESRRTRLHRYGRRAGDQATERNEQHDFGEDKYTLVRKMEMKMIGQNSPATPVPSTPACPSGVASRASGRDRDERSERRRRQCDPEQPPRGVRAGALQDDPE